MSITESYLKLLYVREYSCKDLKNVTLLLFFSPEIMLNFPWKKFICLSQVLIILNYIFLTLGSW